MTEQDVGKVMQSAFDAVRGIYAETGLLMQTIEGLMGPHFFCPFDSAAVWGHSHAFSAGQDWLVTSVSRYWQARSSERLGLLVSIEFLPSRSLPFERHPGPMATAMSLQLNEPVRKNDWKWWWRDECGHNHEIFDVDDQYAPFYHSVLKPDCRLDGADRIASIDNFWIPLAELSSRGTVDRLLVAPLKKMSDQGVSSLSGLQEPFLRALKSKQ